MKISRMFATLISTGVLAGAGQALAAGDIDYYYDEDMAGPFVEIPATSADSGNLAHVQYYYDEDLALHAQAPRADSSQARVEVVNYYYDEDIVDMAAMEEILD